MPRYKMHIAYDGTGFGGWQIQKNAFTIQQEVEKALSTIVRQPVSIYGAGRTDAGVHAEGQVAHFDIDIAFDMYKGLSSLNALLSKQIRILHIEMVEKDFHARFSAKGKEYHYRITTGPFSDPFLLSYAWHIPRALDFHAIKEAKEHLIGTHDFSSFANEADRGSASKNAVRTLSRIDVDVQDKEVRLIFVGDGFLYKMVRNITGALIEVGTAKKKAGQIPLILEGKDRRQAGAAAPAHGLVLAKVFY
jgi:tRNA pseudouridine38-40 synthase